jgi:archaemetzincin
MNISRKYIDRIVKEAIHELGHTFNLRHCPEDTCIMHYCRNEEDVDRKSDEICRYCKVMLEDEIKRIELIINE